ncbi:MAG TPA: hypothetical protein VFQ77_21830 [Pseudonocardiaceae bacterium]|jgi:hypothetical protein|nr:hypothetical protein [Pseudonocardiaceae bacterium]
MDDRPHRTGEPTACHGTAPIKNASVQPTRSTDEDRKRILRNPPDILLTNYVMLELVLTRPDERRSLLRAPRDCGSWCSTSCTYV